MRLLACGGCGHGGGRGSGRTSEPGEPPSPLMKGEQAGMGESERCTSRFGVSASLTLSDNFIKLQYRVVHLQRAYPVPFCGSGLR